MLRISDQTTRQTHVLDARLMICEKRAILKILNEWSLVNEDAPKVSAEMNLVAYNKLKGEF